jgi:arginyl-tRNA synthetase
MTYLAELLNTACNELFGVSQQPTLTRPDEQFGDFASNIALQLAKQLKEPPRQVAEKLKDYLQANNDGSISKIEVAGPGFLNFYVADKVLLQSLEQATQGSNFGNNDLYKNQTVVAEYSDPNPFKVLHAGHLYTTITGDAIASLFENSGAKVHRLNYGGDVGLHVGKTMWAIIKFLGSNNVEKLAKVTPSQRLEWLSARYVEGNNAYQDDPKAKQEITVYNKQVYELHIKKDHQSDFAKIYWTCRTWSYQGFDQLYKQLKIDSFEKYIPESEVTPLAIKMVERGLAEGVFVKSEGAIVFKGEEHGLHTRVFMNSNGLPTYEAKDLGLAATKWQEYHFDLSVIITANDIVEYMKVVLKALEHFYPEVVARSKHLTHGVIKLPGGVKMSSRKGNILRATDIIDAANQANQAANNQENEDTVLAAVKYAFLKNRIGGDIVYDPAEAVALEGNSGPYLQYAHARARSILNKGKITKIPTSISLDKGERSLLRKISQYPEVVELATNELSPHYICTYIYELAQVFNRFYENSRVIGDERQGIRLNLVKAYAVTLKNGLSLLNIPAPEQM